MPKHNSVSEAARIRTLLASAPPHPSGFEPIWVIVYEDAPPVLVYYHDDQMLTVESDYAR